MELLTRQQILDSEDRQFEYVEVPEWGGTVKVMAMSGEQRDKYQLSMLEMKGTDEFVVKRENVTAKLVAYSCVDEKGDMLFTEKDVLALGRKSSAAMDRITTVASRLSKLRPDDVDELGNGLSRIHSDDSAFTSLDTLAAP